MKINTVGTILTIAYIVLLLTVSPVSAQSIPTFPTCLQPQGALQTKYENGTHGVPGDSTTYSGLDEVYRLSDLTLMQCLCVENGDGIQTNWWNIKNLTQSERVAIQNQGWKLIPNGYVWGLSQDPYAFKNISYSCIGGLGGVRGTATKRQNGQVLGLASTGSLISIISYGALGATLITVAMVLRRATNNS